MTDRHPDDDEGLRLSDWLLAWARHHWLFAATVLAICGLLMVPSVWHVTVEAHSRSGMSSRMPLGERGIWIGGVGAAFYLMAGFGAPAHWRMRPPSPGELAVARWLIRAAGLVTMWIAFYITLP
jgi:hypothetical protein